GKGLELIKAKGLVIGVRRAKGGGHLDANAVKCLEAEAKVAHNSVSGPVHHIATNKNWVSTLRGGPWSPKFQQIFQKAGMTLEDVANKVRIPGHAGPHPEVYHQAIFDRLTSATQGLSGKAYKDALLRELESLAREAQTAGSSLNRLLTGG